MTVLQIDREAAAYLLAGAAPDGLLAGRADTLSLVQTLAAHREQATAELVEALRALERNTVELYRVIAPSGNYGANTVGSDKNENTFADADPVVVSTRLALTKANRDD